MSDHAPARVSFPRGVWVAVAVVMLGQLAGILIQLGVVSDQRKLTRQQKAIAEQTLREVGPLAYDTRPLAREARRALPSARRTGWRVDALTREATPLTADLRAADLPDVTRALGVLARSLVASDAAASLRTAGDVLEQMRRTDVIARTSHAAALAPRQYEIQRRTLAIQEQALAITRQTLDVAKATLAHAESLDRKTGGSPPPAAPAPTVP